MMQHEPAGAPGDMNATRGDATPARSSAVTISSITSKRDLISSKTWLASGSLLKKAAANLSHSARLSKPGAWRVGLGGTQGVGGAPGDRVVLGWC